MKKKDEQIKKLKKENRNLKKSKDILVDDLIKVIKAYSKLKEL